MAITIGSNIASLSAQRKLSHAGAKLSNTFERLSSGMRINKASDDAAGLSIAESLRAEQRVYNQAIRNFNDGLSLLNIADSGIESLTNIVIRLKELASQAANGSYSKKQRDALNKEAQALTSEYTRVIQSADFNDKQILTANNAQISLQGGYGSDTIITSTLGGVVGNGTFSRSITLSAGATPLDYKTGDFNGDGYTDIISMNNNANSFSVYLSNKSDGFLAPIQVSAQVNMESITSGDFNNDGILDLAVAAYASQSIGIYFGIGDGTFSAGPTFASTNPGAIDANDFNGDGITDLAVRNGSSGQVSVFLASGSGSFSSAITSTVGGASINQQSADLNNDGIADLVVDNFLNGTVSYALGLGDGRFGTAVTLATGNFPWDSEVQDFNNDGNLDIITAGSGNNSISVYLGDGKGSFTAGTTFAAGSGPRSVVSGDVNGDGQRDLIVNNYNDQTLEVLLGRGDGTFSKSTSVSIGAFTNLQAGDFNGDGVLDIASLFSALNQMKINYGGTSTGTAPLLEFDISSITGAKNALAVFDLKLNQLTAQRSQIGAFQSRLQVGISSLRNTTQNYAAAESRIRDTDVAQDAAELTRLSILQQAAGAVLAQANLQPAIALALLNNNN